jgi:hypothetical protein
MKTSGPAAPVFASFYDAVVRRSVDRMEAAKKKKGRPDGAALPISSRCGRLDRYADVQAAWISLKATIQVLASNGSR